MNRRLFSYKMVWAMMVVMAGLILLQAAPAAASIGKIAGFKGAVIIQQGTAITKVTKVGLPVNNGDIIATREGEANITFNDGAVMKVNPYSNIQLREQDEKSGTWLFKTTVNARRVTCLVGKLWFKSGASATKNYLQSPNAVAGIRGSDGDFGYDNVNTYINMYSGDAAIVGKVIRGMFQNPGIDAATKSAVYQALQAAYNNVQKVQAAPASSQKAVDQAQAKVQSLQVAQQVAQIMQNNPDTTVKSQASLALAAVTASISAAQATVNAENAAAAQRAAEDAAKAATDAAAKKAAADAAKAAAADQAAALKAQQEAAAAAAAAQKAADAANLVAAQQAAADAARAQADAQRQAEAAKQAAQQGGVTVPTTIATTSSVITTAPTVQTTMPLTTTVSTTSTTSTTSSASTTTICPSPPCK
ncbi:MAG: hypothetical protein CSYNP_03976 [Syntrophus sp. SKADARSKE-3]|nr:hypothetical protein [Syntrophus sp. SKADARSKE-3]